MMTYPSTLPCPNVSGHKENENNYIMNTQFSYNSDRVYVSKDTKKFNIRLSCTLAELNEFKSFYASIYDGTQAFFTDWLILEDSTTKVVRMISPYSLTSLGNDQYDIKFEGEVL